MKPIRNFDLATLRSFVQIADAGSMTRAASRLNMTQSAISMQIKRLETSLEQSLFDRSVQKLLPNAAGEQLLHFARQLLALNDEAWGRMTAPEYEVEIRLGVPSDIINPHIPQVLANFSRDFPKAQIKLTTNPTIYLKEQFAEGQQDIILTTEREPGGGKVISRQALLWTGSENGCVWKKRPLPIAFTKGCIFRTTAIEALEKAQIDWVDVVVSDDDIAKQAMVSAGLCVGTQLEQTQCPGQKHIVHQGQLPELPYFSIALYHQNLPNNHLALSLAAYLERAFA
ncbi:MAG: LysR family transcriptional regulator [Thiothrix sp.]|nr:MAG: LysR family transcriptional regulator [Thiothrix sp.]